MLLLRKQWLKQSDWIQHTMHERVDLALSRTNLALAVTLAH